MKDAIKFLIERAKAPTPKFWVKTRNYMLAIGGFSTIIIISGALLPLVIVKIASYGLTTGAIGTALSQLAKIKEDDEDEKKGVKDFVVTLHPENEHDVYDIQKTISMVKGVVSAEPHKNTITFTKGELVSLIMTLAMDAYGDEWIPQEDEQFISYLKREGLFETWEAIYKLEDKEIKTI